MAVNRKSGRVNSVYPEKTSVNGVQPEKQRRQWRLTGRIAALTAVNQKISSVNGVQPENRSVNSV